MKSLPLFLTLLLVHLSICAQESATDNLAENPYAKSNEIKLNALYLIAGAFDLSYERNLNSESSVGLNVFIPFDDGIRDNTKYYVSPYYRFFFGKKYAAGFFAEGFLNLNSTSRESISFAPSDNDKFYTDFGLGVGLGGKWVTKSGFIFELNAGIGRNLFNADKTDNEIIGKVGISLGYRF